MNETRTQEAFDIIVTSEIDEVKKIVNDKIKNGWSLLSMDVSKYTIDGFLKNEYMAIIIKYKE